MMSDAERALRNPNDRPPQALIDFYEKITADMRDAERRSAALTVDAERFRDRVEILERIKDRLNAGDEELAAFCNTIGNSPTDDDYQRMRAYLDATEPDGAVRAPGKGHLPRVEGEDRTRLLDARAAMEGKHHFTDDATNTLRPHRPLPGEMPGLRDHLFARWNDIFATVTNEARRDHDGFNIVASVNWERKTLEQASLWWVSTEMVDVLMAASRSVPDDVLVTDIEPLDRCGLVVLESAWNGVPSTVGPRGLNAIAVDAFLWGPVELPPGADGKSIPGVAISSYQWAPLDHDGQHEGEREQLLATIPEAVLNNRIWFPLGRSDWPNVDRLDTCPEWIDTDQARASFVDDRRVLCALMTLLAHGGIATTVMRQADRATRRRAQRAGDKREQAYRVVTLRELRQPRDDDGDEPRHKVDHDHRWIVQGHWRRQPYGPGRSLRRLQWIHPFVKGPEGMPLKQAEVIRAWRR